MVLCDRYTVYLEAPKRNGRKVHLNLGLYQEMWHSLILRAFSIEEGIVLNCGHQKAILNLSSTAMNRANALTFTEPSQSSNLLN